MVPETPTACGAPSSLSNPLTVLVVEDEEPIRGLLEIALTMRGYRVLATRDAEAALAVSAHHPGRIDLVITDIHLPDINGSDLVRRLLSTWPAMHVLYISGYPGDCTLTTTTVGKTRHLAKPFTPREVLDLIQSMCSPNNP